MQGIIGVTGERLTDRVTYRFDTGRGGNEYQFLLTEKDVIRALFFPESNKPLFLHFAGWMNYFALSEYYRPIPILDQWLRRRVRMCYLKQWRRPRTRISQLIRLGVSTRMAMSLGLSSTGYYRLAKTKAVPIGLNNDWLKSQGLVSVKEEWVKFHY